MEPSRPPHGGLLADAAPPPASAATPRIPRTAAPPLLHPPPTSRKNRRHTREVRPLTTPEPGSELRFHREGPRLTSTDRDTHCVTGSATLYVTAVGASAVLLVRDAVRHPADVPPGELNSPCLVNAYWWPGVCRSCLALVRNPQPLGKLDRWRLPRTSWPAPPVWVLFLFDVRGGGEAPEGDVQAEVVA